MGKIIAREIAITLLFCITVALVLGVILYDYSPNNKVVPRRVEAYVAPDNIKQEIESTDNPEDQQVVISYEIDDTDLSVYEKSKIVDPGKSNPFADYTVPEVNTNPSQDETNLGGTETGDGNTNSEGSSTGTLFEKPGMK